MKLRLPIALFALAASAPVHAGAPQPPTPTGSPANWVTVSDYPGDALRKGVEGTTGFRLVVGTNGRVSSCLITESSGSSTLDETTCRLIMLRSRFNPATDRKGRAVVGTYTNRVRWVIPKDRVNPMPSLLVVSVLVAADGTVSECRVEQVEGDAARLSKVGPLENCGMPNLPRGYVDGEGKPVAKRIRRTVRVELLDVPPEQAAPPQEAAPAAAPDPKA